MSLQGWVRDGWASRHKSTRDGGSAEKCKAQVPIQALRSSARFGSRSAMAGVDLATLKELMGHSNISITMRYVHPHRSTSKRRFENWSVQRRTSVRDARKAVGVPTVRECPKRAADGSGCAIKGWMVSREGIEPPTY